MVEATEQGIEVVVAKLTAKDAKAAVWEIASRGIAVRATPTAQSTVKAPEYALWVGRADHQRAYMGLMLNRW